MPLLSAENRQQLLLTENTCHCVLASERLCFSAATFHLRTAEAVESSCRRKINGTSPARSGLKVFLIMNDFGEEEYHVS